MPKTAVKTDQPLRLGPKTFDPVAHGGVKPRGPFFLFFGVILPTVAIAFESTFHFCARHFFDPFSSPAHVVLFALIPFSNFLVWLGTRRDMSNHFAFMSLASGMAMGVACLYSLMFLPLTPLSCFFTLALGFGLLGLAPLLSLPCNLIAGKTVCKLADKKITYFNAHQVEHIGHMIILVMVVAVELPSTLTRINLSRAADSNAAVAADGVRWLRKYGSQEVLQRACYERSGRATDILGSLYESSHPLSVAETRRIFYQVTGKPFNSVPIPKSARATIQRVGAVADPDGLNAGVEDEFDMDTDIAGEAVSGVARGLAVSHSLFTGKVDPDIALASLDWVFDFSNDSKFDREARAKILLPPDAVVTRATLTVNGVEREATIMVRSAARAQYHKAVVEKKDPLLVSTCGKDQILVQCYPVKPGETMKVKLEIAAPMSITPRGTAALVLPAFLERNFEVAVSNELSIHSSRSITAAGLEPIQSGKDYLLTGKVDAAQLAGFKSILEVQRDKGVSVVQCPVKGTTGGAQVRRLIGKPHYDSITKLVFVVDGSAAMKQFVPQIAEGLKGLPADKTAQVQVVGDVLPELNPPMMRGGSQEYNAAIEQLKTGEIEGGHDDSFALNNALQLAAKDAARGTAVVWLHAAQPEVSAPNASIKEALDRGGRLPLLFDMQLVAGPDEILGNLTPASLVRVPRSGTVAEDLAGLIAACGNSSQDPLVPNDPAPAGPEYATITPLPTDAVAMAGDDRLAKIWANQQICLASESADGQPTLAALLLAHDYKIVSPVSSAIVVSPEPTQEEIAATVSAAAAADEWSPTSAVRKLRANVSKAGHAVVNQLSALSSAAGGSARDATLFDGETPTKGAEPIELKNYSVAAPASPSPSPAPADSAPLGGMDAFSSLGSAAPAPSAENKKEAGTADKLAEKSLSYDFRARGAASGDAPQLQGATNGVVDEGKGYFQRYPYANGAPGADKDAKDQSTDPQSGVNTAGTIRQADADPTSPDGKPVPEADTWMLFVVIFGLFGGSWLYKRRQAKKA